MLPFVVDYNWTPADVVERPPFRATSPLGLTGPLNSIESFDYAA